MILKLAWRNIWRNPQRSLLTLGSLVVALCCSLLMQSQQEGTYQQIIQKAVKNHLGHLQIHDIQALSSVATAHLLSENLVEDFSKNKLFEEDTFVPRLVSQAMVFGEGQSYQNVALWGVHLTKENALSNVKKHITSGEYFASISEKSILIGETLAQKLGRRVGECLTLQIQTAKGTSLKVSFLIKGIFRLPVQSSHKRLIYLPLKTAQDVLEAPHKISYYAIILKNPAQIALKKSLLEQQFQKEKITISTWKTAQPELAQVIRGQALGASFMMFVLYLVVGFGFFTNTVLLLHERRAERNLLISMGMMPYQIALSLALELFFLGLLGLLVGNAVSLPFLYYLAHHPIGLSGAISEAIVSLGLSPHLYYSIHLKLFFLPNLYLLAMLFGLCTYPFYRVYVERSR